MHVHAPQIEKVLRYRDRQRRAFLGIGRRTQFVEQYQRRLIRRPADVVHVDDVGRKRAQVALDRLRIANVRVNRRKQRKLRLVRRHGKPGLRHQRKQPGSFQRDGFAARVRPGNDQLPRVGLHGEREWDRLAGSFAFGRLGAHTQLQQRMARILQRQRLAKAGRRAFQIERKTCPDKVRFHLRQDARAERQRRGACGQRTRQHDQDAMNLGLLFIEQTHELVVLLDGFKRLDEHGRAARRRAVNDTWNAALELRLDRDDEALAAHGDDVFLRAAFLAQAVGGLAQAGLDGAMLRFHGPTNALQLRAGLVGERAVRLDLAAQGPQRGAEIEGQQGLGEGADSLPQPPARVTCRHERPPGRDAFRYFEQRQDFERLERRTRDARLFEQRLRVEEPVKIEAAAARKKGPHLRRPGLLPDDPAEIGRGRQRQGKRTAQRADGFGGDAFAQTRPFERQRR